MNKHIPCKRCSGRGFINWTVSEGNTGTAASYVCPDCNGSGVLVVHMTNADHIRSMSDEELAEMLLIENEQNFDYCEDCKHYRYAAPHCCAGDIRAGCIEARIKWLQQPAEEGTP